MYLGKSADWWLQYVTPDFENGTLYWKSRQPSDFNSQNPVRVCNSWNRQFSGKEVGTRVKSRGKTYIRSRIFQFSFPVHSLIFFLYYGWYDNSLVINHINGLSFDNRPLNLELITQSENTRSNVAIRKDNSVGFKGITYRKDKQYYTVRIQSNGRRIYGGSYNNLSDARSRYEELQKLHHR